MNEIKEKTTKKKWEFPFNTNNLVYLPIIPISLLLLFFLMKKGISIRSIFNFYHSRIIMPVSQPF